MARVEVKIDRMMRQHSLTEVLEALVSNLEEENHIDWVPEMDKIIITLATALDMEKRRHNVQEEYQSNYLELDLG